MAFELPSQDFLVDVRATLVTCQFHGTMPDCNGGFHALAVSLTVEILQHTRMKAIWYLLLAVLALIWVV